LVSDEPITRVYNKVVRQYWSRANPLTGFDWVVDDVVQEVMDVVPEYYLQLPVRPTVRKSDFKWLGRKCKENVYAKNLFPGFNDSPCCTSRADRQTLECAFRTRLVPSVPDVDLEVMKNMKKICQVMVV